VIAAGAIVIRENGDPNLANYGSFGSSDLIDAAIVKRPAKVVADSFPVPGCRGDEQAKASRQQLRAARTRFPF
jgi:hypothetical protein